MTLFAGDQVNSYAQEHEAIQTRFGQMFDSSLIPVQYSNTGLLKKGSQILQDPDGCDQFVRLNLIGGPGEAIEITRNFSRVNGIISISIFTKRNLGSRKGREVADMVYPIFNRVTFFGIKTSAATLVEAVPDNSWYQINISIPYFWDRCET